MAVSNQALELPKNVEYSPSGPRAADRRAAFLGGHPHPLPCTRHACGSARGQSPPRPPLLAPKVLSATWPCAAQEVPCGPGVQGQTHRQEHLYPAGPPQAGDTWLAPGLEAPRRGCNPTCPAPLHGVQAVSTPFPWGAPGPQEHLVRPRVHLKGAHSLGEGSVEGPGQPCPLQCGATGGLGGEAGLCQTAPRAAGVPGRAWAWLGVTLWQLGVGPRDHGLLLIQAPSSCVRVDLCGGCWGQAQGPWPWPAAPGSFLS